MTALQVYKATLVTEEPISPGVESQVAFQQDIHRLVPGTALRGAMAAVWIDQHGKPSESGADEFVALFERDLRPGSLLPVDSYVRPLSVSWCKYGDPAHQRSSLRDDAFDTAAEPRSRCDVDGCGQSLERGKGKVEFPPGGDPLLTLTHVPHEGDQSADKGLHARSYLRAGTSFTGTVVGPADSAFLSQFANGREVFIGGRRSVAGAANLTLEPISPPTFRDLAAGDHLVLRLVSEGIFTDGGGRPLLDLPVDELAEALDVPTVHVEERWQRPTTVGGWHAATGLPKPVDRALVAGSTWLVRVDGAVPGHRLAALASDGLGLRRPEGFGRLCLPQEPWHLADVQTPAPPAIKDERAVRYAATLRPVAAKAPVHRGVTDLLRELATRPMETWSREIARRRAMVTGRALTEAGVWKPLEDLIVTNDVGLFRDVRLVLEARGRTDAPKWLTEAMPSKDGGAEVLP